MPQTLSYLFDGHACTMVIPDASAPGCPWVWRAEFPNDFNAIDQELLSRGWHVAYCRLSDRYGCPSAVEDMKLFHDDAVQRFGVSEKADLFGFSRGGLYACNYALRFPQDVSVLYLDAPVLDIRSWPGGMGEAPRWEKEWQECLSCYGLTEETAVDSRVSPVDHLDALCALRLPLLLIAGEADETVPFAENGARLLSAYKEKEGDILAFIKKTCGHHPHSVCDPAAVNAAADHIADKQRNDYRPSSIPNNHSTLTPRILENATNS